jgi:hypothetical protein
MASSDWEILESPSSIEDSPVDYELVEPMGLTGTTGRSKTNNNPLNLEFRPGSYQDKYKAVLEPISTGGSQRFAKFPSMEAGYLAGLDQIKLDQERGHTLESFVKKFAPPHENPTGELIAHYAKTLGVQPNTSLSEIDPERLIVPMLERESSTKISNPKQVEQEAAKVAASVSDWEVVPEDKTQVVQKSPEDTKNILESATDITDITHGTTQAPDLTPEQLAESRRLLGKGIDIATWPFTRMKEWVAEPLYEKLGPLVGAPMEKGFVKTQVPLDSMMRPGEAGQVGGAPIEGDVETLTPTYRELVTSSADAFLMNKLLKIPDIMKASKAGTLTRFKEMRQPELLWDNPSLGKPVYQEVFKTKLDSTLGPAGTEVIGPTLREGHAAMSQQLANAKISTPWTLRSRKRDFGTSLKTNERILSELDDLVPGVKQEFWTNIKASENAAVRQVKLGEERLSGIMETVGGHDVGDKLGVIAISERPKGLAALKNSGITDIPTATAAERTAINTIKNDYYEILTRINEGRAAAGLQPIPTDINYVTFMRNVVKQEINPVLATNAEVKRAALVPFQYEKKMKGGKEEVATNLFDIFKNYQIQAERHLNISPHVEKINKFVLEPMTLPDGTIVKPLAETNPIVADALLQYGKSVSGRYGQAFTESWGWAERGLSALSNNVVVSMIGAYPKSVLNQIGAITGASALVKNPKHLITGLRKIDDPEAWKFAMENSRVLAQRKMDVVFEDLFGGASKALGELKHKAMLPLETMDHAVATGVWHAAHDQAVARGLKGRKAFDYADEVVVKSQGSASGIDRSNIQRTMMGKALTGLQTFTIADYNLLAREVLGFGNPNKSFVSKGASLAAVVATGTAMNLFYRNVMGMPPPNPEPIETYQKAKEGGASELGAAYEVGKDVATKYAPIAGSMAMGKTPFGPLGGLVTDLAYGYKETPEAALSLLGVPGTNVGSRLYRSEPGMELREKLEELTTLPLAQRTELKLPPMSAREALLGRLEIPPQNKIPNKWEIWLDERLRRGR